MSSSSHPHHHRKRSSSPPSHPSKKPSPSNPTPNQTSFPSYLTTPNLPPNIHLLCRLVSTTPPPSLPPLLSSLPPISPSDLETLLKLSYSHPHSSLSLFRFAATHPSFSPSPPSPYSWNLLVDLLGKNHLFPLMWDAIRSMPSPSLSTFASVFSSFALSGDFPSALLAFDQMQVVYGVLRDTAALNSLLSAVCRAGRTVVARDLLRMKQNEVPPDGDSFAILMEGWESEGDARRAKETFDEMVEMLGWDGKNVAAYDSFLGALMKEGGKGLNDVLKYVGVLRERRCYPGAKFFRRAMEEFVRAEDEKGAREVWECCVGRNGCYPDKDMFWLMIKVQCYANQTEAAQRYLDEMVVYGVFPDGKVYNLVLQYLIKGRRLREASAMFNEMVKNEVCPSEANCNSAFRIFMDVGDWEMGIKIWKFMVENGYSAEECGNMMVGKLKDLDRLPEACRFAEDMIDRRVKLNSATLSKLRTSLLKIGKGSIYDHILRKWKLH